MYIKIEPKIETGGSNDKFISNHTYSMQRLKMLFLNDDYVEVVAKLKKEFGVEKKTPKGINRNKFNKSLEDVFIQFNIPFKYFELFSTSYIMNGTPYDVMLADNYGIKKEVDLETGLIKRLYIEVYPDTPVKDITKSTARIKEYQKLMVGYDQIRRRLYTKGERDQEIVKLAKQGLKHREIMKQINQAFEGAIGYEYVSDILRKLSKRVAEKKKPTPKAT